MKPPNRLTLEEKEAIEELTQSALWMPLLRKAEELLHDIEQNLVRYNLANGSEGLVLEKARAEGAAKLLEKIKALKPSKKT